MRVLLVVNTTASSVSRRKRLVIEHALRADFELEVEETSERDHAVDLARGAAAAGVEVVAVLSGDGTLNEAAHGLAGTETALAPLPGGSTDVFARTIGVSRDVVDATAQLLESLEQGSVRRVGLGLANGRHFLFTCGIGFDAAVVEQAERRSLLKRLVAHPLFAVSAVTTWLFHYDHSRARFRVELPSEEPVEGGILAVVSNTSPYSFFGPRSIVVSPGTTLDTGLGLTVFRSRHLPTFAALAGSALATGRMLRRNPTVAHRLDLERLTVVGDAPFPWQVDGEFLGETTRLEVVHRPGALKLVIPTRDPAL